MWPITHLVVFDCSCISMQKLNNGKSRQAKNNVRGIQSKIFFNLFPLIHFPIVCSFFPGFFFQQLGYRDTTLFKCRRRGRLLNIEHRHLNTLYSQPKSNQKIVPLCVTCVPLNPCVSTCRNAIQNPLSIWPCILSTF